jgi:hypothetical protein
MVFADEIFKSKVPARQGRARATGAISEKGIRHGLHTAKKELAYFFDTLGLDASIQPLQPIAAAPIHMTIPFRKFHPSSRCKADGIFERGRYLQYGRCPANGYRCGIVTIMSEY